MQVFSSQLCCEASHDQGLLLPCLQFDRTSGGCGQCDTATYHHLPTAAGEDPTELCMCAMRMACPLMVLSLLSCASEGRASASASARRVPPAQLMAQRTAALLALATHPVTLMNTTPLLPGFYEPALPFCPKSSGYKTGPCLKRPRSTTNRAEMW